MQAPCKTGFDEPVFFARTANRCLGSVGATLGEVGHRHGEVGSDLAPPPARFWLWFFRLNRGGSLSKAPFKPSYVAFTLNQPVN